MKNTVELTHPFSGRTADNFAPLLGPIYRAAPKYVVVNDPAFIHEVHKWDRLDWFITLDPQIGLQSVGTARTMVQHNAQRRRIATAVGSPLARLLERRFFLSEKVDEL
ncbi:hypothetical protein ASPBRDRAFT_47584 [Aspergillus brasiliensis CBS 101740]|uniref:Uncharacterized protein n=1 Tax=Aspergillus brasiliensis (strain CBS 101740 / IMI 381727 / IBT 21946) TaxID=767769 RepID=A0A1L9U786_ASPBC|nr:hypothetical protein ASPBRDRAFT_47584 [Aspergillus brasiliensis CBS 101740]